VPLPPSPIGFDSTVLINFGEANCFELLIEAVTQPRYLLREAELELLSPATNRAIGDCMEAGTFTLCDLEAVEMPKWVELSARLGAGEAATIAAAKHRGWSVALDDKTARGLARIELGKHRLTGTIGILVYAVEVGCVSRTDAQGHLDLMISNGYWSPTLRLP
jgi:predicted nucleic acid-binding protein